MLPVNDMCDLIITAIEGRSYLAGIIQQGFYCHHKMFSRQALVPRLASKRFRDAIHE
jgi:hypothetical protein